VLRVGSLYAIAAVAGMVALSIASGLGASVPVSAGICVAVTTVVRAGSVRYGWSLPAQRALSFRRQRRSGRTRRVRSVEFFDEHPNAESTGTS
jgi:hypothetical protein